MYLTQVKRFRLIDALSLKYLMNNGYFTKFASWRLLDLFYCSIKKYCFVAAQNNLLTLDGLIPGQIIGYGTFTRVYVVQSKLNSVNYALKVSSMEAMPESQFDLAVVRKTYQYNIYISYII